MNKLDILFTIPLNTVRHDTAFKFFKIPSKQKIFLLSCFPNR